MAWLTLMLVCLAMPKVHTAGATTVRSRMRGHCPSRPRSAETARCGGTSAHLHAPASGSRARASPFPSASAEIGD